MSTDTPESRIARLATPPASVRKLTNRQLLAIVLCTHGFADIIATAAVWHLGVEQNSFVIAMGLEGWVAFKLAVLLAFIACWGVAREHRYGRPILAVNAIIGTGVIGVMHAWNAAYGLLMGVL